MRAVVQRVHRASVHVDGVVVGEIGQGLVAFVAAGNSDDVRDAEVVSTKIAGLRVFEDDTGKMSKSVQQIDGGVLAVSQFTLYGDVRRGRRPSFDNAMEPHRARELFDAFITHLEKQVRMVQRGVFGATMRVMVDNDGPVTILIDSHKLF